MKNKILLLLFIAFANFSFAMPNSSKPDNTEGIKFSEKKLEEALSQAKAENKLIFIDAYADWCGPCKWMAKNTFTDTEVGTFFNNNFVSLQIDMESDFGIEFDSQYNIEAYPTLLFLDAEGKVVKIKVGALNAGELLALGRIIVDPSSSEALKLEKEYLAGNHSQSLMEQYFVAAHNEELDYNESIKKNYIELLQANSEKSNVSISVIEKYITACTAYEVSPKPEICNVYFDKVKTAKLIDEEQYSIFYYYQNDYNHRTSLYFFENFQTFSENWGDDAQNKFMYLILKAIEDVEKGVIKKEVIYELLKLSAENEEEYQLLKKEIDNFLEEKASE